MTREEARIELQAMKDTFEEHEPGGSRCQMALKVALAALRGLTREMVKRAWFREPYTRMETRSTPEGNRQYIAENICMACGSKTPIGHFCHNCGVALDDWAVDMMLEKWRVLYD